MKAKVYVAVSLDGFIARKDGALDWLDKANARVPDGEDCGFAEFMHSVDALIMGRKNFEQVLSFGQWGYGETPVIVLSSRPQSDRPNSRDTVTWSDEKPRALLERLSSEGVEHVYIDGGTTIQSFIADNLIDEITLTVIPVLLGEGISLFGKLGKDVNLRHERTQTYDFGFVQIIYKVRNELSPG